MDFKLCIAVLLTTSFQISDCLHYYKTPALDNQFSNFEITTSIPSDGRNGSQSIQEALLFSKYNRQYITFTFKGKGHAQLQLFFRQRIFYFKVEIGGGTGHKEVCIFDHHNGKKNSTTITGITSEYEYRSFYIQLKWKTPDIGYMVYVGLGSDPRTNHVLYADIYRPKMRKKIHHISISTASDCFGEWQFASAGQLFGGCGNGTVCSNNSIGLECNNDDKSIETGLFGTCTPEFDDFSTVNFGNGTFRKGTQNTTGTNVRGTTMRSGSLVATIDRRLSMLVVLYCAAASFVQFRHG